MKNFLNSIYLWFDSSATTKNSRSSKKIDWIRCSPFFLIHIIALSVFLFDFEWHLLGVLAITYSLRVFTLTAFYHRYFSHRAFKTSRITQFIFAFIGTTAAQRGPLWWSAHHRHHHKYADKSEDHHSPKIHNFIWSHCGWFLADDNFSTDNKYIKDLLKYPELKILDRFDIIPPIILCILLFIIGGLPFVVWGFFVSTVLVYHVTFSINSLAHMFGKQDFETGDDSKNNWLLALVSFGEGWHNNHHYYPSSARQGRTIWQLDISYMILKVLEIMHIVWDMRKYDGDLKYMPQGSYP